MPFSIRPFPRLRLHCSVTYNARPFLKLPLASLFGFGSLITLLFLSSVPAYARWVAVGESNSGATVYVDPDTIRRKGDLVKLWVLGDFNTKRMAKALKVTVGELVA